MWDGFVNYELETMWKGAVVAYFKVPFPDFPGGKLTTKILDRDNRSPAEIEPGTS
jgi:hypothetical protein